MRPHSQWISGIASCLLLASAATAAEPKPVPVKRYEFRQEHMSMPFEIALYAPSEAVATKAARAVSDRIEQLNASFSDYDADSELNRLCATAGMKKAVPVGKDLLNVLVRAIRVSEKTQGAFDVSVGPFVRLWRKARREKALPTERELNLARGRVGYEQIVLDEQAGTVELRVEKMQLDLGGIAVGYAIDESLKLLKDQGITSAMIDGSGDVGVSDAPPGAAGWKIGIAPLEADGPASRFLMLRNAAVTTSGDAYQFVEIDGMRYSHIIDPRTGLGLTDRKSVTVVATNCATADAYATALCVLDIDKGLRLIEDLPKAAVLIVRSDGTQVEMLESPRFKSFAAK